MIYKSELYESERGWIYIPGGHRVSLLQVSYSVGSWDLWNPILPVQLGQVYPSLLS